MKNVLFGVLCFLVSSAVFASNSMEAPEAKPCRDAVSRIGTKFPVSRIVHGSDTEEFHFSLPSSGKSNKAEVEAWLGCDLTKSSSSNNYFGPNNASYSQIYRRASHAKSLAEEDYKLMGGYLGLLTNNPELNSISLIKKCFVKALAAPAGIVPDKSDPYNYDYRDKNGKSLSCGKRVSPSGAFVTFHLQVEQAFDFKTAQGIDYQ